MRFVIRRGKFGFRRKRSGDIESMWSGTLPSMNEYIDVERGNRYAAAAMKREAQDEIIYAIREQSPRCHYNSPVRIWYLWVERNRRKDKSNVAFAMKFIEDAMVESGLIDNDGWNDIDNYYNAFAVDCGDPRVEVTIEEVEK